MNSYCDCGTGQKAKRLLVALVAGGVGIIGILVGFWLVLSFIAAKVDRAKTHVAAAVNLAFEKALREGRTADAYALTSSRYKQHLSEEDFQTLINLHPALKGPEAAPYSYDSRMDHIFASDRFTFTTKILNHGHTACFTSIIVEEGGQWRVDALTFH